MHHLRKAMYYILIFPFFLAACTDEDICEECNVAIQHMCAKIEQNNCNPDYMESALEKLRDACGYYEGNVFAGYMAHSCNFGDFLSCGDCQGTLGLISLDHLSVKSPPFTVRAHVINPDSISVTIAFQNNIPIWSDFLNAGEIFYSTEDTYRLKNEENVIIRAYKKDPISDDSILVLESSEKFSFYRPGNWTNDLIIDIKYDFGEDAYIAEYTNW